MAKNFGQNDPKIAAYVEKLFAPEDEMLKHLREHAEKEGLPDIHVGNTDGLLLEILVKGFNVHKAVEIGTLAGYSGIRICRGLQPGGRLFTFEFSPKHAAIAQKNFATAGFDKNVEILVGPALENLSKIESYGPFDLVFIDADKANYKNYFQWAEENLKVGGVLLADNTFAWGMIADSKFDDPKDEKQVKALQAFNQAMATSPKFKSTIVPTGEGLTLGVKIKS